MFIIKYKKIFVAISAFLVICSIASVAYFGLNMGIDFKGGSMLEVAYEAGRPDQSIVAESVKGLGFGEVLIQPVGESGFNFKTRHLNESEHKVLLSAVGGEERSFTSIGPSVGKELARKSLISFILVVFGIIFFVAFSFRHVSKPVSSWKYGIIAVVSLVHDVIIPIGIFAVLGHFYGAEVGTLFVVAILTILGLSVSDTVVVFDRIRENLRSGGFKNFSEVVGRSVGQVYPRSIMTSVTTILVLLALVFWGPESTRIFAIILTAGMFFGTYSSIFLASPLLVMLAGKEK
jgi:preprotein translocase subunit SecF